MDTAEEPTWRVAGRIILVTVSIWVGVPFLLYFGQGLLFRVGWMRSAASLGFQDIATALVAGIVVGIWNWSDYEKKRQAPAQGQPGSKSTKI
jgi:hypothetical protein